jgi:DNA-binding transcriptional ArsR family regulator
MCALADEQAKLCAVFGNARRLLILWSLSNHELSVGEIAEATGTSMQNTSQHLFLMKSRGILASRRKGHTVYYRIAETTPMRDCLLINRIPKIQTIPGEKQADA